MKLIDWTHIDWTICTLSLFFSLSIHFLSNSYQFIHVLHTYTALFRTCRWAGTVNQSRTGCTSCTGSTSRTNARSAAIRPTRVPRPSSDTLQNGDTLTEWGKYFGIFCSLLKKTMQVYLTHIINNHINMFFFHSLLFLMVRRICLLVNPLILECILLLFTFLHKLP